MRKLFLLLLAAAPLLIYAQDLTGVWQGHFRSGDGVRSTLYDLLNRYKFEVQIAQHDKKFDAVTYSYLSSIFYGKAAAAGTVNPKTGKVLLQEGKLIEVREQFGDIVCIMTCFLQYTKSGDEEFLEGRYVSMNLKDSDNCGHGTVFLRKVASSAAARAHGSTIGALVEVDVGMSASTGRVRSTTATATSAKRRLLLRA